MERKIIPTSCYIGFLACGALAHVEDGKLIKVTGNPEHPWSAICPKCSESVQALYNPNRPIHPMKRTGDRGEGKWERITWEEALETVADRFAEVIDKHGPESILAMDGSPGRTHALSIALFMRSIGSPNVASDCDLCEGGSWVGNMVTIGEYITDIRSAPDIENTKCLMLAAVNPAVSAHPKWVIQWRKARANGAKLIVLDPRRTESAEQADLWLQVRPGTDTALGLAMLHTIINEGLYDKDFIDKWTVGFDRLKDHVQQYPPEKMQETTWVPADKIREAARMFATTKPAGIHYGVGLEQCINALQNGRVFSILIAITGNIDVRGGNLFKKSYPGYKGAFYFWADKEWRLPPEVEAKRLGARNFPLWSGPDSYLALCHTASAIQAMLYGDPYPVKAAYIGGNNVVLTYPNSPRVWDALKKLDFLVVSEPYDMTPTAELADILLPKCQWLENKDIDYYYGANVLLIRQPVVQPRGEAREELEIMIELRKKMEKRGMVKRSYLPWNSVDEFVQSRLKDTGVSWEELSEKGFIINPKPIKYKEYEERGFATPSGKVELYSSILERHNYPPLPIFVEPSEGYITTPELAKKYPLMLLTGIRDYNYWQSRFRDIPRLRQKSPEPWAEIHHEVALARGIEEGDRIWVETTSARRIELVARVTDRVHPKTVITSFGWYFPEKPGPEHGCFESNSNVLVTDDPPWDPGTGVPFTRGLLCEIGKA